MITNNLVFYTDVVLILLIATSSDNRQIEKYHFITYAISNWSIAELVNARFY